MLGSWRQQEQELAAIISAETSPCTLPPPAAWCSHFTVDNSRYNSRYDRTLRPGVHAVTTHPRLRPAVGEQTTAVHSSPATAPESAFHIEAPPTAAAPAPQHHSTTAPQHHSNHNTTPSRIIQPRLQTPVFKYWLRWRR